MTHSLPAMTQLNLDAAYAAESVVGSVEQASISTDHVFHAGMYARTMVLPAGHVLVGALVKIPTIVIFNGDADVFVGGATIRLTGYHVVPANAMRKQIYKAHTDCHITALFATDAESVAEAEDQATGESERLISRKIGASNTSIFTGERPCLLPQQSQQ